VFHFWKVMLRCTIPTASKYKLVPFSCNWRPDWAARSVGWTSTGTMKQLKILWPFCNPLKQITNCRGRNWLSLYKGKKSTLRNLSAASGYKLLAKFDFVQMRPSELWLAEQDCRRFDQVSDAWKNCMAVVWALLPWDVFTYFIRCLELLKDSQLERRFLLERSHIQVSMPLLLCHFLLLFIYSLPLTSGGPFYGKLELGSCKRLWVKKQRPTPVPVLHSYSYKQACRRQGSRGARHEFIWGICTTLRELGRPTTRYKG
jgi:hypothetical protein